MRFREGPITWIIVNAIAVFVFIVIYLAMTAAYDKKERDYHQ